jgi:hypothetical protein
MSNLMQWRWLTGIIFNNGGPSAICPLLAVVFLILPAAMSFGQPCSHNDSKGLDTPASLHTAFLESARNPNRGPMTYAHWYERMIHEAFGHY